MISTDVIIIWPGTNASIPSGYTRVTGMDGRHVKSSGAEAPDTTGGSNTHTHTGNAHGHTVTSTNHYHNVETLHNASPPNYSSRSDNVVDNHDHQTSPIYGVSGGTLQNTAATWASANQEPPYYTVIFIKSTGRRPIPANAIVFWNEADLPTGMYFCDGSGGLTPDLRNKYLKGAAAGADGGGTGGSLTHAHTITHGHTANSHTHSGTSQPNNGTGRRGAGGGNVGSYDGHRHSMSLYGSTDSVQNHSTATGGSADTVQPAYKKLAPIRNISGINKIPKKGTIALWAGAHADIPTGWKLCDGNNGTPNLADYFIKCANSLGEIGDTGGSNMHTHSTVSHTHLATGTHTHSGPSTGGPDSTLAADSGGEGAGYGSHVHVLESVSYATAVYDNYSMDSGASVSNQPAYTTLAYIMLKNPPSGMGQEI